MKSSLKKGITIPELVGILAMIGVLCGTIVPHLLQTREASQLSNLRFNLKKLRQKIEDYRKRSGGEPPARLKDALDADSLEDVLPDNPVSHALDGHRNRVKKIDTDPPLPSQVTPAGMGGWLYNPKTGGLWPDHQKFLDE